MSEDLAQYATVKNWMAAFKRGGMYVQDEHQSGTLEVSLPHK